MKISDNYSRFEFACRCGCGFDTVDAELITVLEDVRREFGVPITINSGARCSAHNRAIGGSKSSQHILGRAADIVVRDVASIHVHGYLNSTYPQAYGLGYYEDFTHIDTRGVRARWS